MEIRFFDNHVLTSNIMNFCGNSSTKLSIKNGIINSIDPTVSPQETMNYYYQSTPTEGLHIFICLGCINTEADDDAEAVPIDFGDFVGNQNSTVAQVKKQITDDLEAAYLV